MLSFIIPTYKPNRAVFEKCLRSLKAQGLEDWEAIVVFDGECPEGQDIVKEVKDKRIRSITIEHGGAPKARNAGFAESKGEYVVFWDSDCYIEPGASRLWVDIFDKHKEIGLIYSGYKFTGNKYAIESRPWDPYLLRVRNYVSGCFPTRRELVTGWDENLKSLQDWDFWLRVVKTAEEKGYDINKLGRFLQGYSFETEMPSGESISAKGCTNDVWLERMDAVRRNHAIEEKKVCVCSVSLAHEGIRLAKLIGADYQDNPNDKPNRYETVIQVGFSLDQTKAQAHADIFAIPGVRKIVFWTAEDILVLWRGATHETIRAYNKLLENVEQFVEDEKSLEMLTDCGFKAEVLPMPIQHEGEIPAMPEEVSWAVDIDGTFSQTMTVLDLSLPDIKLVPIHNKLQLKDFMGLIHLHNGNMMTNNIKRALLTGRHVISNVPQPYAGFLDDKETPEKLLNQFVDTIRKVNAQEQNLKASSYYAESLKADRLLEVLNKKAEVAK